MTLHLEVGKTYRSRQGEKISIESRVEADATWPFRSDEGHSYEANGAWDSETGESRYDLIAPWVEPFSFQSRVEPWMDACFGPEISADKAERNHRFLEESLELVQACGCSREEALQLVDYVYGRPVGEPFQEVGGVKVTLAALSLANGIDMHEAGEAELARVWTKIDAIRAKQAAKPRGSALPVSPIYASEKSTESAEPKPLPLCEALVKAAKGMRLVPSETATRADIAYQDGHNTALAEMEAEIVKHFAALTVEDLASPLCGWRNGKRSTVPFDQLSETEKAAYREQAQAVMKLLRKK